MNTYEHCLCLSLEKVTLLVSNPVVCLHLAAKINHKERKGHKGHLAVEISREAPVQSPFKRFQNGRKRHQQKSFGS